MNRFLRAIMVLVMMGSLAVGGVATLVIREIRSPAGPAAEEPVPFEIGEGETAAEVAQRLQQLDLIRQPLVFRYMASQRQVSDKLQAGTYELQPSMTTGEILDALQNATPQEEKSFTVIPGSRLEEIAEVFVKAEIAESTEVALAVMRNTAFFKEDHTRLKDIPDGQSLEGYLFPDTYQIFKTATITDAVERMLDEFDTQFATFETEITAAESNIHKLVTMASIVQREAANNDEMPHIAWIFYNRLKPEFESQVQGRLQADPTVQYAAGYDEATKTWWRKNIDSLLSINSPYNTRVNAGLPPGPIASPGLQALRSAARPGPLRPDGAEGEKDLYFVATCGGGATNFAADFAEFGRLEQEYLNCPDK